MLTSELNDLLTHVGPGTPGGEFMRRYWQPVGTSHEIKPGGQPKQVRILGEDLVLFRDVSGRPGLLRLHCSHRLVSLAYGRVEDGGIRCPFHGWLYDVSGRCLEQPAEPDETFKDRVQHPSYPCEELGGLVFAYLGPPERKPLLPHYEALVREDGSRKSDYYPINSNYLQHLEGAVDAIHFLYLHAGHWSKDKFALAAAPKARIDFVETEYGLRQRTEKATVRNPQAMNIVYTYFVMPAGFLRIQENYKGAGDCKIQSWYVPADDVHTLRFQAAFVPQDTDDRPVEWPPSDSEFPAPGPHNDYFRDYERYDTISGIPGDSHGTALKGFLAQDCMANETQGPIVDRSRERLGAHDPVLTAMRMMMVKGIADVQQGLDPKHIIRDPEENEIIYVRTG